MRNLTEQLTQYAAYHRDVRNIATHFVGIPLIVLALAVLLGRPALETGALSLPLALPLSLPVSPAWLLFGGAAVYYLVLDVPLGLMMALISVACVAFGAWLAAQSTAVWLGSGIALFVVGWVFQFVGHAAYEHRKPAFVDDLAGLIVGPLFVLAEALFGLGWRPALRAAIEAEAGPTRVNPTRGAAGHRS